MKNRTILGIVAGALLAPLSVITVTAPVHADSGAGYTYICSRINNIRDSEHLVLSRLWTCSNGYPVDDTNIAQIDNYSGRQTAHASGECLWLLHKDYGYQGTNTDMAKAFAWCSTHTGWPGKGIKNPPHA